MSRNSRFILIGALAICVLGASYLYYQERQKGIDIQINGHGVSIKGN